MKKKCPNCGFIIKKIYGGSKKEPYICSQCHAQLYFPAWISWLQELLVMTTITVFFLLMLIFPWQIGLTLFVLFILSNMFLHCFFKPKVLKKPDKEGKT